MHTARKLSVVHDVLFSGDQHDFRDVSIIMFLFCAYEWNEGYHERAPRYASFAFLLRVILVAEMWSQGRLNFPQDAWLRLRTELLSSWDENCIPSHCCTESGLEGNQRKAPPW